MSEDQRIDCADHGSQGRTFVCQHLAAAGQDLGFHRGFDPEEPDALFPDAWCDACEAVREREGDWNERSEKPRSTHSNLSELIRQSIAYLQPKQDLLTSKYRLSHHERYDWHQESGQLIFSNDGKPAVVADIQFVGSLSFRSKTWMWSWANESFLEKVRSQIRRVRAYGDEHSLLRLACAYWGADEEDGWEMTAVAAYLLQAQGAYRSPDEHGHTFMIRSESQMGPMSGHVPAVLEALQRDTAALGFTMASDPLTGAFLRALAASKPGGRLLELGTGTGLGTSWILAGMDAAARLDTMDNDPAVLEVARRHLGGDPRVTFHLEDGAAFLAAQAPGQFDLVYTDTWAGKFTHRDQALALLRPGGVYFTDDLTRLTTWPEGHADKVQALMADLESRDDFVATRMAWATGLMLLVRKSAS